jgi:hypothetical protein
MYKRKDQLLFEIWIFRNGQPDCRDDHVIFIAMTYPRNNVALLQKLLHQQLTSV